MPFDDTSAELGPLADLLPEALLLVERAHARIVAANRAAAEQLGEALVGRTLHEISTTPRESIDARMRSWSRTRTSVPGTLELTTRRGVQRFRVDGSAFRPRAGDAPAIVLLRIVPHRESTAQFVALDQKIVALNREITRRAKTEAEAVAGRERLRVTLASIGDAVIATDERGRVSFLNPVAEQLTGWSSEQATDRPIAEVFRIIDEETREPVEGPVDKVLRDGSIVSLANHTVLIARDGTERPIDDSGAPIFDGGRIVGVILVFRDFTERKRLERTLQQHVVELAEAGRRKDEFLAMLGHELRNPLAPVRTALELMRLDPEDVAMVARYREVIERQVDHLVRLVDDLLDMSRITRGLIELRRERVEILRVVQNALERSLPLIEQRRHRVEVSVPEGLVVVGDAVRLEQVVANLLHNAAKYTEAGGEIAVCAARDGDSVEVRVRDNGTGIAPALLPKVFDLFVQGAQTVDRSKGGLGLGLTLVKRLVEMHDGSVSARSEGEGRGTEVIVRLPLAKSSHDRPSRPPPEPEAPPRRLLIVDDNLDAASLLGDAMQRMGNEPRLAHDGLSALEVAREWKPDVVLLDIGLPGIDGYEVARRVRADPSLAATKLVAVTGYGQASDVANAHAAGFDAHTTKPVDLARLRRLVASLTAR